MNLQYHYALGMSPGKMFIARMPPYEGNYHVRCICDNIIYVEERDDIAIEITDTARWIELETGDMFFDTADQDAVIGLLGLLG